jgi:hypothetical protein
VLVFIDVDRGGKAGSGEGFIVASLAARLTEYAIDAVLQSGKLAERLKTGKYGREKSLLLCWFLGNSLVSFTKVSFTNLDALPMAQEA